MLLEKKYSPCVKTAFVEAGLLKNIRQIRSAFHALLVVGVLMALLGFASIVTADGRSCMWVMLMSQLLFVAIFMININPNINKFLARSYALVGASDVSS